MSELSGISKGRGADDFAPLLDLIDGIEQRVSAAEMKSLGRTIAKDLRGANAKRLRANVQPEGDPMTPRKAGHKGRARTKRLRDPLTRRKASQKMGTMFQRAVAPRYLRAESSQGDAQVGFVGAMARIMSVHHFGLRDTVTRDPKSPEVTYAERKVIGMTSDDRLRILYLVDAHLAG